VVYSLHTMPPLLPWQGVDPADGTVDGTASTRIIVPTIVGMRVDCVFGTVADKTGCMWSWGDGAGANSYQDSLDNTAGHTYATAGTYTVQCSGGHANGTVQVTVPGAMSEGEEQRNRKPLDGKGKHGMPHGKS
jgi:hypothetical protein